MARKGKPNGAAVPAASGKSQWVGDRLKWVDGYLGDEDRKWLETNRSEVSRYVLALIAEQAEGYKISCKFEPSSGKYQASLLPDDVDCPNAGFGLSHRANDPTVALFVLSYKHFVKFERRWGEIETPGKPESDWD